ncbi:DUF1574 family protein [Winogradskyella sp.]|uniref:DUF1574 family protein n=1 Tax=Winogradskyella sp. TaxID=1883156 RepID=UPI0025F5F895|nr:DUF1574 family protein [Winogradskyella sp.]
MKKKNLIHLLFKSGLFIILMGFLTMTCAFMFGTQNSGDLTWSAFYKQKKNSIDLLFFGNSHLGNGLDLNIVNAKTKSKVYTLYSSGQTLPQTYYNIKEALKYQTPKLIVIETFAISSDTIYYFNEPVSDKNIPLKAKLQSFDSKKLSLVKIEEYRDLYKGEEIIPTIFPLIRNHSNWADLDLLKGNLAKKMKPNSEYYFGCSNSIWPLSESKIEEYRAKDFGKQEFKISKYQRSYFNKIIELAKDNNIEVLLVTIPYFKEYRKKIDYKSVHNSMIDLALKNNIKYLDLNHIFPDLSYQYFTNEPVGHNQHLSYKGGIVVSNYLSKYINNNYKFKTDNANKSLPEYYLYNKIKRETLNNGDKIIGNLDAINGTKNTKYASTQGKGPIVLDGWIAIEGKSSKFNELFIALVRDNNFIYVSKPNQLKSKNRKDVTKYFNENNNLYDDSGFLINIDSKLLELGRYSLYMVLRNNKGEVLIKDTFKTVEIL